MCPRYHRKNIIDHIMEEVFWRELFSEQEEAAETASSFETVDVGQRFSREKYALAGRLRPLDAKKGGTVTRAGRLLSHIHVHAAGDHPPCRRLGTAGDRL